MHMLLSEATNLAVTVNGLKGTPHNYIKLLQIMPQFAELINKIHQRQPEAASVTPEYVVDEVHFNDIWRQGMLCFVYHEIFWLESTDLRIQTCVQASLAPFQRLSWLQACLWRTFRIAVHCRTDEARTRYETKLRKMHTTLNFTAPLSIFLVLKNIWKITDRDASGKTR